MSNIGLPVPPGFIVTTATCLQYFDSEPELPFGLVRRPRWMRFDSVDRSCPSLSSLTSQPNTTTHKSTQTQKVEEVAAAVKEIEKQTGREFGNPNNPLLFSVRSGAAISMPGMMDTGTPLHRLCVYVYVCVRACVCCASPDYP